MKLCAGGLVLAGFASYALPDPAVARDVVSPAAPKAVWTLSFPPKQEIGNLFGMPTFNCFSYGSMPSRKHLCRAKGTVTITKKMPLLFVPNDSVSEQPQLFDPLPDDAFIGLDCERLSLTDSALDNILHLKSLTMINLEGNEISDAGVVKLKLLPNLVNVNVFGTNIQGRTIKELGRLKNLVRLRMGCNKLDLACLGDIAKFEKLEFLNLDRVNLCDQDLLKLMPLKKLWALEIPNNPKITGRALAYLKKLPNLRHIDLRCCSLTARDLLGLNASQLRFILLQPESFTVGDQHLIKDGFKGSGITLQWKSREAANSPELYSPLK